MQSLPDASPAALPGDGATRLRAAVARLTDEALAAALEMERMTLDLLAMRAALELSTNGLSHAARWNITDQTRAAITTQIIANRQILDPIKQRYPGGNS